MTALHFFIILFFFLAILGCIFYVVTPTELKK